DAGHALLPTLACIAPSSHRVPSHRTRVARATKLLPSGTAFAIVIGLGGLVLHARGAAYGEGLLDSPSGGHGWVTRMPRTDVSLPSRAPAPGSGRSPPPGSPRSAGASPSAAAESSASRRRGC